MASDPVKAPKVRTVFYQLLVPLGTDPKLAIGDRPIVGDLAKDLRQPPRLGTAPARPLVGIPNVYFAVRNRLLSECWTWLDSPCCWRSRLGTDPGLRDMGTNPVKAPLGTDPVVEGLAEDLRVTSIGDRPHSWGFGERFAGATSVGDRPRPDPLSGFRMSTSRLGTDSSRSVGLGWTPLVVGDTGWGQTLDSVNGNKPCLLSHWGQTPWLRVGGGRSVWESASPKSRPAGYGMIGAQLVPEEVLVIERFLEPSSYRHTVPYGTAFAGGGCPRHFVPNYDRTVPPGLVLDRRLKPRFLSPS